MQVNNIILQVRLIDSGKIVDQIIDNIYEYCGKNREFFDLPPRCFECSLAQIQPSQIQYPSGQWPIEAKTLFENQMQQKTIEIEVNRFEKKFLSSNVQFFLFTL